MQKDSALRSMFKAISWRFFGSISTSIIVYAFTGQGSLALAIGGVEVITKIGIFFVHERIWDRVQFGKRQTKPQVIWFTGLPSSGKTTLSLELVKILEKRGLEVEHLDGDSVRKYFPQIGFSKADRDDHIRRMGFLASRLQAHGTFVVASFVSPYRESRELVRGLCQNFVEIHVATPLSECEKRDVKGMYAKARAGELPHFTGVDDPYEEPLHPELRIETSGESIHESIRQILEYVDSR